MGFDLTALLRSRAGENFALHERYLNRQLAGVLKTIGFDRDYVRAQGCYLYDRSGRRYLDFLSGYGVFGLGRSHPVIKDALHQAIDADLPNLVQMDCALLPGLLAEALIERTHPGLERVFFSNSGAEAVEAAIKFARVATGRARVLSLDHAFHGLTTGALALNGGKEFRRGFGPLLPGCDRVPFGDVDALERQLRRGEVAAFVAEPIQGKGVYLAPEEYWRTAQQLCRSYGTLFVADEVQTGLGRTGTLFCHERYGVEPDILTVSKALSGGYVPIGATLCSSAVFDRVFPSLDRAVVHSSTFGRNQLAMVAGLATLQVIEDEHLVKRAEENGAILREALAPLVDRYELFQEVRGLGMMIGLQFGRPSSPALRAGWTLAETARRGLFSQLVVVPLFERHGILTQVAADGVNVVKLLPPLIAGPAEIDAFVDALDDVLHDAHRSPRFFVEVGTRLARGVVNRQRT
jgi:ornithine--oxo-acid transaminase